MTQSYTEIGLPACKQTGGLNQLVWSKIQLLFVPVLMCCSFLLLTPHTSFAQCNPAGNVSRYEFNVDPTTFLNIMGQQFCTSQSMGTNCCGQQNSYRCLDIVLNLSDGPQGETFSSDCNGMLNLMTEQGNFDALFFSIGAPNPAGNATNCAAPINLGNNYTIGVSFTGDNTGLVTVVLSVTNNMGNVVFNDTQTATAGQSVIFTICKPGFGCVGDELVFGCCNISSSLSLATSAASTICTGETSTLKVSGIGGTPPYTAGIKAENSGGISFFDVTINDDQDGNTGMDMTTFDVNPNETTTYTLVSIEDASGCVQPGNSDPVTITVNDVSSGEIGSAQTICSGGNPAAFTVVSPAAGSGTLSYRWESSTTLDCETGFDVIANASGATYDPPAGLTESTAYRRITISTLNGVACEAIGNCIIVNVNPLPQVEDVPNQTYCAGDLVPATVFTSDVPGATFAWSRTNQAIGLAGNSGTGNVPSFTATNNGSAPLTATFSVVASYTSGGVTCTGSPTQFTITVNPSPQVNPVANKTYCAGTAVPSIIFTSNTPGATFSWSRTNEPIGLAGNSGTGNVPAFNATNAGNTPITATFSVVATVTDNGVTCTGTPIQFTVTINPTPNAVATPASQTICSGSNITTIVLSGNVTGTTYNWTRDNTASVTGIAASGSGNISGALNNTTNAPVTVTFTITPTANSCTGAPVTATVLVNPVPTTFSVTGGGVVCTTDVTGVPVGLSSSQTNVNYQLRLNGNPVGAPVAGTGAAISFGPQLTAGTYTVLATHTQGGCTSVMTGSVAVTTFNCAADIISPCGCKNNATTLTNGQFDEVIKVNAPSGQVWTVVSAPGLYSAGSPAPPLAPVAIPAGTQLTNLGGNMFQLNGIHVDALGYTVTVTNNRGTTLSLGNTCAYPNPEITSDLSGDFCLYSNPVTLEGTPGDNNIVSQGFTVNGVPATQFNPNQGVGTYVIKYTVNGGAPKAVSQNDPGCIQSVSQTVHVVATPSVLTCNDLLNISLDGDCEGLILPDDILEGTYGCYDDYVVELDRTLPFGNGPWTPATLGGSDIGKTYQARVRHLVSGNKCWGNVKIEDYLAPTLVCENFSVPCNTPNLTPDYLFNNLEISAAHPEVSDCSTYTLTYIDSEVAQACNTGLTKIITRKWVATDAKGNSATCNQLISLTRPTLQDVVNPTDYDDIDAPAFHCADNAYPTPDWIEAQGLQGYPYVFGQPSGCSINWGFDDLLLEVCDGTYKIRREWTIIDWCLGDGYTYNQIIKVLDDQGPAMDCPDNLTVSTNPTNCCATVNLPDIIIEDNCSRIKSIGGMVTTFEQYTGEQTGMYPIGGNLVDFPGNNKWDPDTLGAYGWTPCLPQGNHIVTYLATDDCGNTATCSFHLSVYDDVPPAASCDQTTIVGMGVDNPFDCYTPADGCEGAGVTWIRASTFDDGSYDQCSNVKLTIRRMAPYSDCISNLSTESCYPNGSSEFELAIAESDSIKFYCCEVGTTQTVILRVYQTDVNGNISIGPDGEPIFNECMVQAQVQDKLKPVCLSPANVTVSCETFDPSLWSYGKPTVADNCCLDDTKVYQGQCGLTHAVNYAQFDTLCNKGTITRTFRAFDCHGQSSQCTQRIVVNYEQDYFVRFPNDVIVTVCDGTGSFGEPTFFGEDCELLGVTSEDHIFTVVPDACFKIERDWKIINWCTYQPDGLCIAVPNPNPNPITNHPTNLPGPIVSPIQTVGDPWKSTIVKLQPTDGTATNYSIYYNPNANCYTYKQIIKVLDTQDPVVECPASPQTLCDLTGNDAQLWNESYWWDNANQLHDLCEAPVDICITATDACSGANINIEYQLFLDLDGDGVMETIVNSTQLGSQPGGLGWNNVLFGNLTGAGTSRQFDERPVPQNQKWGFAIQETTSGVNKTACVKFNTFQAQNSFVTPQLPHGVHKIKWFVSDGCGNETVCEYTIVVKDCKAPTVVCINGLSVNIMPTGMITMWASDFLQYAEDNCTLNPYLKYSIRKCGTGTGFPVDAQGNPITNVTFTCDELGTQCVELWAIDLAGNADYCESYVIVQDNIGSCPNSDHVTVSGILKSEMDEGIEAGTVLINGSVSNGQTFSFSHLTDAQGIYTMADDVPVAADFTISVEKDENPLNGVTTYDLVLMSKHILGIAPLGSPYKMIAADANKSNSITTFDIVEIRKLILGIYNELPNNKSWRFIDKAYDFPIPANPFMNPFPETITVSQAMTHQFGKDFVGVKIGDVNNTATASSLMSSDDRSLGTLYFDVEDRDVAAGETFEVTFKAAAQAEGFQMTLNLNGLSIADLRQSDSRVSANNFGVFADALTVSIDGAETFTVTFRADKAGKLSQMLGLSSRITKAEAYAADTRLDVALRFASAGGATISGVGFELYQNEPNPYVNKTMIGFSLPEAATATLNVYDETGRVVYTQKGDFGKGYNAIYLDGALVQTTGVLYYTLETATDAATKKMVRVR